MKKYSIRTFLALALALVMLGSAAVCEDFTLLGLLAEQSGSAVPESAAALIQKDLYQMTINNTEIAIREAAYDGRSLFLVYSYRMTDVDHPLGVTAADFWGEEIPDSADPAEYVYGLAEDAEDLLDGHNIGWWIDEIWIDGKPLDDMPDGSGQFLTGTDVPGELVESDIWRLDNLGVFLKGKVRISLPIGDKQNYMDYYQHPEKYDADGYMLLPEKGVVTFVFDAGDILSAVRVIRPESETELPDATVKVTDAAFTPMMTYIRIAFDVKQEALDAFIAENGEYLADEDGEPVWYYGPMDVIGEWMDSLQLTDGNGTILFPDVFGPDAYSDTEAEFLLPCLEILPDALYLAPVNDDGIADLGRAVPLLPADS